MKRYAFLFLVSLPLLLMVFLPSAGYGFSGAGGTSGGAGAVGGFSVGATSLFGGKIASITPCTCSAAGTNLIFIPGAPPRSGVFTVSPISTKRFARMKPIVGSWAMGDYLPSNGGPTECYLYIGATCLPAISQGTIKRIATS